MRSHRRLTGCFEQVTPIAQLITCSLLLTHARSDPVAYGDLASAPTSGGHSGFLRREGLRRVTTGGALGTPGVIREGHAAPGRLAQGWVSTCTELFPHVHVTTGGPGEEPLDRQFVAQMSQTAFTRVGAG